MNFEETTPEEIYADVRAAYEEAADRLRDRLDELDKSYRLMKSGVLTEPAFRDIVGFSARTAAFCVRDTLRRLGEGLDHNPTQPAEAA